MSVRRGKQFVTTKANHSIVRPLDLVARDFTRQRAEQAVGRGPLRPDQVVAGVHHVRVQRLQPPHRRLEDGQQHADFTAAGRPRHGGVDRIRVKPASRTLTVNCPGSFVIRMQGGITPHFAHAERLVNAGALVSIGIVGDSYDNSQPA